MIYKYNCNINTYTYEMWYVVIKCCLFIDVSSDRSTQDLPEFYDQRMFVRMRQHCDSQLQIWCNNLCTTTQQQTVNSDKMQRLLILTCTIKNITYAICNKLQSTAEFLANMITKAIQKHDTNHDGKYVEEVSGVTKKILGWT